MTTHTLNGREVRVIELPHDAQRPEMNCGDVIEYSKPDGTVCYIKDLPPGFTYSILLDTKEAGEKNYFKLVKKSEEYKGIWIYWDYENGKALHTATDSFHSFLRSNGYDPAKRYVLISQNKK
jgi:hypothetical protein